MSDAAWQGGKPRCAHATARLVHARFVLDDGHGQLHLSGMCDGAGGDGECSRLQRREQVKEVLDGDATACGGKVLQQAFGALGQPAPEPEKSQRRE